MKQARKVKTFLFKSAITPLLITTNFLKWIFKFGIIYYSNIFSSMGMQYLYHIPGTYRGELKYYRQGISQNYNTNYIRIYSSCCSCLEYEDLTLKGKVNIQHTFYIFFCNYKTFSEYNSIVKSYIMKLKKPFVFVLQYRCFKKFRKSLLNNVTDLRSVFLGIVRNI